MQHFVIKLVDKTELYEEVVRIMRAGRSVIIRSFWRIWNSSKFLCNLLHSFESVYKISHSWGISLPALENIAKAWYSFIWNVVHFRFSESMISYGIKYTSGLETNVFLFAHFFLFYILKRPSNLYIVQISKRQPSRFYV